MHFTRADVEAKAKAITESFTFASFCELLPPQTEVKINGFYVLLKTNIVMERKILEKPKESMMLLMKMET